MKNKNIISIVLESPHVIVEQISFRPDREPGAYRASAWDAENLAHLEDMVEQLGPGVAFASGVLAEDDSEPWSNSWDV